MADKYLFLEDFILEVKPIDYAVPNLQVGVVVTSGQ